MTLKDIKGLDDEQLHALYVALGRDTALFAKVVMGHIVKDVPDFHKDIYSMLDDMTDRAYNYGAAVIFRGGSKSTISKPIKTIQDIVYLHEPVTLLISESISQASMDLIGIQDEIENNEMIMGLYGNLKGDIWNKENCEFTNGVFVGSKGYGSRIRGFKWKNQRPTRMVLDDFESEHNTATAKQREEVVKWINAQVLPAGAPETIFQFFGTIVHEQAWLASIQDLPIFNPPLGRYIKYAIEENGKPVWEKRFPREWIDAKRNFYAAQKQMSLFLQEYYHIPAHIGEAAFDKDRITIVDGTFGNYEHICWITIDGVKIPVNTFIGVDPASTIGEKSDNTVVFTIGVDPKGHIYILDIAAEKIKPSEQVKLIFEKVRKYRPKLVTVETQGYQLALANWLREKMNEGWTPIFPIKEFKSSKSKNAKFIMGLEPIINTGRASVLRNCEMYNLFEKELVAFNGVSKEHDDTLDGMYLACLNSYAPQNFNVDNVIRRLKDGRRTKRRRSYAAF